MSNQISNQETLDFLQILYGLMVDNFMRLKNRYGAQKVDKLMSALDRQIQLMVSNPSMMQDPKPLDQNKTMRFLDLGDG